ncbi:MAG TPA: hypothetical protein VFO86_08265 [Terriglobia bacterium]|nr:hypothetical protein [Terriglobia bacterium]
MTGLQMMLRIATMIFASFLAATGTPDTPADPAKDTITVPTFIPGFDDVDPVFACSPSHTPNRVGFDGCGGNFWLLPWNTLPSPPPTDRIRFVAPAT